MWYFGGAYPGSYFTVGMVGGLPSAPADELAVEIPMWVVTEVVTRVVSVAPEVTIPMAYVQQIEVPMTRGMSEQAEIPMRVLVPATLGGRATDGGDPTG